MSKSYRLFCATILYFLVFLLNHKKEEIPYDKCYKTLGQVAQTHGRCPWKHYRSGWTGLWATWSGWRWSCSLQGGWIVWSLKVPSDPKYSTTLWHVPLSVPRATSSGLNEHTFHVHCSITLIQQGWRTGQVPRGSYKVMLKGIWQDSDLHQCSQCYSSFAKAGFIYFVGRCLTKSGF